MKKRIVIDRYNVKIIVEQYDERMTVDFKYLWFKFWFFEKWEYFYRHRYIIEFDKNLKTPFNPLLHRECTLAATWNVETWNPESFDLANWINGKLDEINAELQDKIDHQDLVDKQMRKL